MEDDHRSNWAGPALAAAALKSGHPELDIQFFHRAKSGANIEAVSKQIDLALTNVGGRIDVLTISVGGNDVGEGGFGSLITTCLESLGSGVRCSGNVELNEAIRQSFEAMPGKYAMLASHIARCDIGEVFITEYFDLTRGSDGEFCADIQGAGPVASFEEMKWAYEKVVVPLNEAVQAAASAHGWNYVGGIAESFRNHGYCADRPSDPRPTIPNPHYDPKANVSNDDFHPVERLPNPAFNPVPDIPNLNYDPVQNKPNLNYDPVAQIPNPNYQPFPLLPNYDPRLTIPNPKYDPRLTVPNSKYDPRLTVPNPNYNPALTVANPAYDPNLTKPNPDYDPALTIPNPDYYLEPEEGQSWVVRLDESFRTQGDRSGTAHPNRAGHGIYRDRMVETINQVGLTPLRPCPRIARIDVQGAFIRMVLLGDYPSEQLEIQRASNVADTDWAMQPATLTLREDQMIEAVLDYPGAGPNFFRVRVK
jgi:hypothetical protein